LITLGVKTYLEKNIVHQQSDAGEKS
jgi:hypothetical protein